MPYIVSLDGREYKSADDCHAARHGGWFCTMPKSTIHQECQATNFWGGYDDPELKKKNPTLIVYQRWVNEDPDTNGSYLPEPGQEIAWL